MPDSLDDLLKRAAETDRQMMRLAEESERIKKAITLLYGSQHGQPQKQTQPKLTESKK